MRLALRLLTAVLTGITMLSTAPASGQVMAIRAGGLVDPEAGVRTTNQVIVVEDGRITAVGTSVPNGAQVIDLSHLTVLPGLVDAHNHLALTYKEEPESNIYYAIIVATMRISHGQ